MFFISGGSCAVSSPRNTSEASRGHTEGLFCFYALVNLRCEGQIEESIKTVCCFAKGQIKESISWAFFGYKHS